MNICVPYWIVFCSSSLYQGLIQSAFEDIVSDELKKLKQISWDANLKVRTSVPEIDDVLWEYDGVHDAYQGDCEEILLEMQRIFYEDLNPESNVNGKSFI